MKSNEELTGLLADMEAAILAEAAANGIEATTWAEADGGWGLELSDLKKAFEKVRRLQQANADLRKARESAVEEAKRQHTLAKGAREQADNFAAHCETAVRKADALTDDRDALAADNARLREALGKIRDRALPLGLDRGDSVTMLIAEEALTATPDQYLAAHISSLHKSVDGPLPEIESITTTGEENGDSYRQIIQAGIDDLAKNAEGVADGQ